MKTIVAIVVYNRFQNIELWIRCWKQCNTNGAELIIIHNHYGDQNELQKFKSYCESESVKYVPRDGKGFDIGAFQDACTQRLTGFPNNWTDLIWITDDVIPMNKNFVGLFIDKLNEPGIGCACMEISPSVTTHVRTTGFAIKKQVAAKLTFPADPVTTKEHCYLFEHRGEPKNILYNQIILMGLKSEMVAPKETSPLWDSGYWKRLDRQAEHEGVFPPDRKRGDKVVFICPIFEMYPQIISSLICQTHKNWELLLIHNGPCESGLKQIIKSYVDHRITFIEYPDQTGKWGHPLRKWALNEIKEQQLSPDADYICISNADNYHAPSYCEFMIKGFAGKFTAVATYCTDMVHNYKKWGIIPCRFQRGFIDCAGVVVKKDIACEIGWRDVDSHSADWVYFSDIAAKYGPRNFVPVKGCLLIHN